jgi:Ulp1 family protease
VQKYWTERGPTDEKFSSMVGAFVTRKDILTLRGKTWLNDEPITFYSQLINKRSKDLDTSDPKNRLINGVRFKRAFSFNSFFWKKFNEKTGYDGVKRFTKKVSLPRRYTKLFFLNVTERARIERYFRA